MNNNVTFLTFGDAVDESFKDSLGDIQILPIYKKIKYSNLKLIRFLKSFIVPFYFKNDFAEIQVVKTNQLLGSWVAIIIKYLIGKPLMIRTGYDLFKFKNKQSSNIFIIIFSYILTLISLNLCNVYTTTSLEDYQYLKKNYFFKSKKLHLLPNWVEDISFPESANRYSNRVLMVGRLEPQKNFHKIIEILKGTDIEIDIYGEGSQRQDLLKKSKDYRVNLNLMGTVENQDLLKIYPKYKLFISTSLYEGNPKTILEAMSQGCLVLSLENKSTGSLLKNGINSVTFKNEDAGVAKTIYHILNNFTNYKKIRNKAYQEVIQNNSLDNICNKEITLLGKI